MVFSHTQLVSLMYVDYSNLEPIQFDDTYIISDCKYLRYFVDVLQESMISLNGFKILKIDHFIDKNKC